MNERIEELAEQAGIQEGKSFLYTHWNELSGHSFEKQSLEKFAGLIVRECAKIAKKEQEFNARYTDADLHPQVNIDQCILLEFDLKPFSIEL